MYLAFFYADDGLLLARSCAEAEDMIGLVVGMARRYGLNINKGKSYVLLCNHRGIPPERVRRIAVVNSVRYLETDLGNIRMCYNTYKRGRLVRAEKKAIFRGYAIGV